MKLLLLSFVCTLLLAGDRRLVDARTLYYAAVDGDRDAQEESTKLFELLHREGPDNARISAYLGSLRLLESSTTFAIWRKGKLAREGLNLLDSAVNSTPADLEIRFVRAATTFHLPPMFKREEQCLADLTFLAEHVGPAAKAGTVEERIATAAMSYYRKMLAKRKQ